MAREQPLDLRWEAEVEQVRGAEVHGDRELVAAQAQAPHLLERPVEHEGGERPGEAALLDEREEVTGAEHAADRMVPAYERLDAVDGSRPQVGLRLIVQDELPRLQRRPQLADEWEPLTAVVVATGEVDLVARAHALGLVHRDVRALEQPHRVVRVGGEQRDADARIDVDLDAADGEGLLERRAEAQPRGAGRRLVAGLEDHGELVAAEPRERVLAPEQILEARADLTQHLVTRVMAERVVELLEAVEVDEQQRELCAPRPRVRDGGV